MRCWVEEGRGKWLVERLVDRLSALGYVSSLVGKRLVGSRRKNHGNRKVMRGKVVERHEVLRFHKGSFGIMSVFRRESPLFLRKIFFRFHFLSIACVMVSPQNQKVPFSPISRMVQSITSGVEIRILSQERPFPVVTSQAILPVSSLN